MNRLVRFGFILALVGAGCSTLADDIDNQIAADLAEPVTIGNVGGAPLEGHTPQGFAGSGTGLFAGDNLNPDFPDGEGVQIFVAFELPVELAAFRSATLTSDVMTVRGTPFESLGTLRAEPVAFETFGPDVFDTPTLGNAASCAKVGDSAIECSVEDALTDAVDEGRSHLQLRIRFDTPGDGDGEQDLAMFFRTDSNTAEPGIFTLTID